MSEWRELSSTADFGTLPEGSRFLLIDREGGYHVRGFFDQDPPGVTHWMPLPPPPSTVLTPKESAADVARMVDEAKGVLEAVRKAYGWLYSQQKYFNEGDHFEAGMSKYSENAMNELRPFLDKKYPLSRQHCPSVGTTKPYDPADHRL